MKISDIPQDGNMIQYIQQNTQATPPDKAQVSPGIKNGLSSEDRVDLSAESREIKKIHDVLATTPEVRTERVEALKKLVESGQYEVNSGTLAEKMIKDFLSEMNQ